MVSQTLERVTGMQNVYNYTHKAEMNLEYFQLKKTLGLKMDTIKYMVFIEPQKLMKEEKTEHDWMGVTNAVKIHIDQKE